MEAVKEVLEILWAQVGPYITSWPVLVVLGAVVIMSIVKRLVKTAVTIGIIVVLLFVLRQHGFELPIDPSALGI